MDEHQMNKRIKELAEQAGFIVDQSGHITVCFTSDGNDEVKKFAELIVRECAAYAFSDDQDHKAMLKHFGVEE